MHMLDPSDDDESTIERRQDEEQHQHEAPPTGGTKATRVKIEIDDDDDDTGDEVEVKINTHKQQEELVQPQQPTQQPAQQQLTSRGDLFYFTKAERVFPMCGGDKELTESIVKWGLADSMTALQFSYDLVVDTHTYATSKSAAVAGAVHCGMLPELAVALFNSDAFRAHFHAGDGKAGLAPTPVQFAAPVSAVRLQPLRTTQTTLAMFDRLADADRANEAYTGRYGGGAIVREGGNLQGMPDVFLPHGITVSDQLRGLFMLGEEDDGCDYWELYSADERTEFLWHVMWRLVAGGAVNQYEDNFEPYKSAARDVYKSLISVGRDKNSGELEVQSLVAQITDVKLRSTSSEDNFKKDVSVMRSTFFPKDDATGNHNFLYLIVDPVRRTVILWYSSFYSPF